MKANTVSFLSILSAASLLCCSSLQAEEPNCSQPKGSLARPNDPIGLPDHTNPIEHTIVFMMENHSFDNVFGKLNKPEFYGNEVDGITADLYNPAADGTPVVPFHLTNHCIKSMNHGWDGSHEAYNLGKNDQFVISNTSSKLNGDRAMGYYDERDYPLMYALANQFSVGDRYFASVMGATQPNRRYAYAGTSAGQTSNTNSDLFHGGWSEPTIFESLTQAGVSWTFYISDVSIIQFYEKFYLKNIKHFKPAKLFDYHAKHNKLAQVVFVENSSIFGEEHPPFVFDINQRQLATRLKALSKSASWKNSAVFLSYDEGDGGYDHVAPPKACAPDEILPNVENKQEGFERLGFRVPALVISPYAKRHFVSHTTYDHTSILRFIEDKYNIPALSRRDANANSMADMFDFEHPDFTPPKYPNIPLKAKTLWNCLFHQSTYR